MAAGSDTRAADALYLALRDACGIAEHDGIWRHLAQDHGAARSVLVVGDPRNGPLYS